LEESESDKIPRHMLSHVRAYPKVVTYIFNCTYGMFNLYFSKGHFDVHIKLITYIGNLSTYVSISSFGKDMYSLLKVLRLSDIMKLILVMSDCRLQQSNFDLFQSKM
jgi:hypothetical protein